MKNNVLMRITSTQSEEHLVASGDAFKRQITPYDNVETIAEGTAYDKGENVYYTYYEPVDSGLDGLKVILKYSVGEFAPELKITRYSKLGDIMLNLIIGENIGQTTEYVLPTGGRLEVRIETTKLEANLEEDHTGTINAVYKMIIGNDFVMRSDLTIDIKPLND